MTAYLETPTVTIHSSDSLSNRWYSDSTIGGTPGIGKTVDVTPSVSVGTLTVQLETPSECWYFDKRLPQDFWCFDSIFGGTQQQRLM